MVQLTEKDRLIFSHISTYAFYKKNIENESSQKLKLKGWSNDKKKADVAILIAIIYALRPRVLPEIR